MNIRSAVPAAMAFLMVFVLGGRAASDTTPQAADTATGMTQQTRFKQFDSSLRDSVMKLEWPRSMTPEVGPITWTMAQGYVSQLNRDRYLGQDDWRLPSREEFLSLIEYVKSAGFNGTAANLSVSEGLHAIGLQTVNGAGYWTATESWYNEGRAWTIDLSTGTAVAREKSSAYHVITVRSLP